MNPMKTISSEEITKRYLDRSTEHIQKSGKIHQKLLFLRQKSLKLMSSLIEEQVKSLDVNDAKPPHVLFDHSDLIEFATGSIVKALGPEYGVYQGRRSPRIPNGDLLLMSRILSIQGQKGNFTAPSQVTAQYDVPADAWYFNGEVEGNLPLSILLEIALQPCGVLSAYLGTQLKYPEINYFFRNLDGQTTLNQRLDVRGKTIQTRATLLKTIFSGTTIIQHFTFELTCDGISFYRGSSSFGYFPAELMASQVGLDGGNPAFPWFHREGNANDKHLLQVNAKDFQSVLPAGKLNFMEQIQLDPIGGKNEAGYIYAVRQNSKEDWYYTCHFYEDPVMPGSLGIETIAQAAKIFAANHFVKDSRISLAIGQELTWKYRGQVLQQNKQMQIEIHFHKIISEGRKHYLSGDASLWADDLRIYEVQHLTFEIEIP